MTLMPRPSSPVLPSCQLALSSNRYVPPSPRHAARNGNASGGAAIEARFDG